MICNRTNLKYVFKVSKENRFHLIEKCTTLKDRISSLWKSFLQRKFTM